jgi:hypothetical protein
MKDNISFINNQILYNKYKNEYNSNITIKEFINLMKEKGYELIRRNSGRGYLGLKMKNEENIEL